MKKSIRRKTSEYTIQYKLKKGMALHRSVGSLLCLLLWVCLAVSLVGCGLSQSPVLPEIDGVRTDGKYEMGTFDSADRPVLVSVDAQEQKLTFLNLELGKQYTLSYDGTSTLFDKYGTAITAGQLKPGEIVDVQFMKKTKHLANLQISPKAWYFSSTDQYVFDSARQTLTIGADVYELSANAAFFSEGKKTVQQQISNGDVLSFYGVDKTIYSMTVERGHGYLRLSGIEYFVGGWIEVGTRIVERVEPEMLLPVAEGIHAVKISHNGNVAEKQVVIEQNAEATLDFSDVEIKQAKEGIVVFSLTPSEATLYIDGEKVDASKGQTLTYGMHQLLVQAEGYDSVTRYLSVGEASAGISITLEAAEKTPEQDGNGESSVVGAGLENSGNIGAQTSNIVSGNTVSGNTVSGNTVSGNTVPGNGQVGSASTGNSANGSVQTGNQVIGTTVTNYFKVYIDSPENVEVYLDGIYVGVSPCTFKKVAGAHVITLQKEGYSSRNYTIQVDGEEKDISYSFVELVANQ